MVVAAEQIGHVPLIGKQLVQFTLGGETLGGATLSRFFVFHVFIVPALIFSFVGLHLWLVLRHGIAEPPGEGGAVDPANYKRDYEARLQKTGRPFWPDAAWRDVVFGFAMLLALLALAIVFGPPALDKPPDPSLIQAEPRPDWYLLWYFAILALLPPAMERYLIVLGPLAAGGILFIVPLLSNKGERSPLRRPWAVAAVVMVVAMIGSLWYEGAKSPWSPNFDTKPLSASVVGTTFGVRLPPAPWSFNRKAALAAI